MESIEPENEIFFTSFSRIKKDFIRNIIMLLYFEI